MSYEAVIGLETHVQLKTKSKMWCGCANQFGAPPNTHVCPVCLGLPGVLPVANEEALRLTLLTGMLLNATLPPFAKFDRKNYFYPDMPKNYQITQYDKPSTIHGFVDFEFDGGVARVNLTRAHLEEDVGKSFHFERNSGVDFNRAGVPLLEIVSEPEIRSARMACDYLNALVEILRYGGISDCDMEKGEVRCDVNVSVRPEGAKELGRKIEIKNMNSFSGVRRALEHEIPRQIQVLNSGGQLTQETRRWDDAGGITEPMRTKEMAHDYRYFPEPDLMPFAPTEAWLKEVAQRVVELPLAKKQRLMRQYQLPAPDAQTFTWDRPLGDYFEKIAFRAKNPKAAANWIINNLRARLGESGATLAELKFKPEYILDLVDLVESRDIGTQISSSIAQQVFAEMFNTGNAPAVIVKEKGWAQVSDAGAIEALCDQVIAAHRGPVADYKSGKTAALNFLKGQVMKLSKGKANPNLVREILDKILVATGTTSLHVGQAMSNCWVIKWNRKGKRFQNLERDWARFLREGKPFKTLGSNATRDCITVAKKGDVVFCYQTDLVSIVGLCRIANEAQTAPEGWCLELSPETQFDAAINIRWAKVEHPELRKFKAFQQGRMQGVHRLEEREARILFQICGLNPG